MYRRKENTSSAHLDTEPVSTGNIADPDPPPDYDTIAFNADFEPDHDNHEYMRETSLDHVRVGTNPYHSGYDQTGYNDDPPKYDELPPPLMDQYSPARNHAVTQQPMYVVTTQPVPKAVSRADQFPTAVCVTVCCFFPSGIAAIYFAVVAQRMYAIGNIEKAERYQRLTRALIFVSLGFGLLSGIAFGILIYYLVIAGQHGPPYS